jgi:hypothetical protein
MNELKLLIDMVSQLPTLAVWVLVGFIAYKIVVVGSIYGLFRLMILKTHDYLTKPKEFKLEDKTIDGKTARLLSGQLRRISSTIYIHPEDVERLKKAIDDMELIK